MSKIDESAFHKRSLPELAAPFVTIYPLHVVGKKG